MEWRLTVVASARFSVLEGASIRTFINRANQDLHV